MKKTKITKEQYDAIADRARAAQELLESERFQFVRDYLAESTESITESILNNTIRDVEEAVTISDKIVRTFKTPKKVQVDELAGQYRWLIKFIADLQYFANEIVELEKEVEHGTVVIE